jgi:hypothetical protein
MNKNNNGIIKPSIIFFLDNKIWIITIKTIKTIANKSKKKKPLLIEVTPKS